MPDHTSDGPRASATLAIATLPGNHSVQAQLAALGMAVGARRTGTVQLAEERRQDSLECCESRLLKMIIRNEPLATILCHLSQALSARLGGEVAVVMLPGPDEHLDPETHLFGAPALWVKHALVADAAGLSAAIRGSDEPVPLQSRALVQAAAQRQLHSCWAAPVSSCDGAVDAAVVALLGGTASQEGHEEILGKAARLAGIAIAHHALQDNLAYQARYDRLTGLPNRWLFDHRLEQALERVAHNCACAALLWVDLDRFKEINDALGHRFGDDILIQAANRLTACVPPGTLVARMGGDEFAVLLPSLRNGADAEVCAAQVCEEFRRPFHTDGYELFVTASVGIAIYPEDGASGADLQRNVDMAMYSAKEHGRNTFRRFEQKLMGGSMARLQIEQSLSQALPRREFELFYQPQVTRDCSLKGMEALIRWRHPKLGLLIPRDFVKVAEETGLIVPMGSWVISEACRQAAEWHKQGLLHGKVAVNVSALQFYRKDFVQTVETALRESGLPPALFELELTETVLMCNFDEAVRHMQRLRALGVGIAIDDFGTGYSSLSYLQRLPADTLKIDRSFVEQIGTGGGVPIIHAISTLAHNLGLSVVAEGIESDSQFEAVCEVGVDLIQGYLFGMPMPPGHASARLSQG